MAKVNFGGGITDMRGKLAGNAFSRNKSGAYVRAKVTPVNPNTVKQSQVRSGFGGLSAGWRALTEAQRESFVVQAPNYPKTDIFGNAIARSGQQVYMHLNNQLLALGLTPITTCPPPVDVSAPVLGAVTFDSTAPAFEVAVESTLGANEQLVFEATEPLSAGISNAGTKYRLIEPDATVAGGIVDLQAQWEATFGPVVSVPAGSKVFIRAFVVSTLNGQTSAYANGFAVTV